MNTVDDLIRQLYSHEDIARQAQSYLVEVGSPAVEPLLHVLYGRNRIPGFPEKLGDTGLKRLVRTYLRGWSSNENEFMKRERLKNDVRGQAALILGDIGDARAAEPMAAAAFTEADLNVRSRIVLALCHLARRQDDPRVLDALRSILDKRDRFERDSIIAVMDFFGRSQDSRALDQIIEIMSKPEFQKENINGHAAKTLGNIGDPRAVQPLCETLVSRATAPNTIGYCIRSLRQIGDPRGGSCLLAFVRSLIRYPAERWDDREANMIIQGEAGDQYIFYNFVTDSFSSAVAAIRSIGDPETIAELAQLLEAAPVYIPRG